MTEPPVSPLRRRMIEDMTIRKFAPRTQEGYIRAVKNFSAFLGASPDTGSFEDLRRYQLHLVSSGAGVPTLNHTLTALRFLFMVTLRKPDVVIHLPFVREPRRLPVVLSPAEVARLLDAAPGLKYKAALSVAYGAGLRASEVISLKSLPPRRRGSPTSTVPAWSSASSRARACPCEGGGPQGPLRDAVAASARSAARLVEGGAAPGLAVSGARSGAAAHDAPTQPRLSCRRTDGRDRQARISAHAAAQLRDASARAEDRHSRDPEPAPAKAGVLLGHKKLDTTALHTRVALKALGEVTSPLEHLAKTVEPPA
jgi:integrase/recombinase XerD